MIPMQSPGDLAGGAKVASRTPLSRKLNALKICLSLTGSRDPGQASRRRSSVLIEIAVEGQKAGVLECQPDEIGLPLSAADARSRRADDSSFTLPEHILTALEAKVPASGVPLWLSFPTPSGYLAALPWERLLRSRLSFPPILRLSYTPVQPITPRDSRDIVLCFSFARAKQTFLSEPPEKIMGYFFEGFPQNMARYTTFHVFTDAALFPLAAALRDRYRGQYRIELYDPQSAGRHCSPDSPPESPDEPLDNPWMLWMRDSLGTRSVDIVHFICHGYLGREEGSIALAESPLPDNDQGFARFMGARQICAFLDQVGAWSVAFSSPPGNYSILGLRLLEDQVAHLRPGPVLFHDMARDADRTGLQQAYQFAYAVEEAQPPMSTAVSLACHPEWAMPWTEKDATSRRLLEELTLAGRMSDVFEGPENTPSWLASGQRALESSLSELVTSFADDPERILDSGAADGLRFTASLLQKHAQALRSSYKQEVK
jgi:hypothetical protein